MLVVAVIALIFIGPDQIPEVARTLGRFLSDLRRSTDDLKREFNQTTNMPKTFDEWMEQQKKVQPQVLDAPSPVAEFASQEIAKTSELSPDPASPPLTDEPTKKENPDQV